MKEQRTLSNKNADGLIESLDQKELGNWYVHWGQRPWYYAVICTLKTIPFALLFCVIFRRNEIKPLFTDTFHHLQQHWSLYLVSFVGLIICYRVKWKQKAFRYYLYSHHNSISFPLDDDSKISQDGETAVERLRKKYAVWHPKRNLLVITGGVVLPVLIFSFFYLVFGIRDGHWSYRQFMDTFESGVAFLLFVILMLFSIAVSYLIWKEIKDNYNLLEQSQKGNYVENR